MKPHAWRKTMMKLNVTVVVSSRYPRAFLGQTLGHVYFTAIARSWHEPIRIAGPPSRKACSHCLLQNPHPAAQPNNQSSFRHADRNCTGNGSQTAQKRPSLDLNRLSAFGDLKTFLGSVWSGLIVVVNTLLKAGSVVVKPECLGWIRIISYGTQFN